MDFITIIGLVAGTFTTISFLPQVIKIWRTKSARDISLEMFLFFCAGVFLWLVYGLYVKDVAVIAANFVTLILAATILFFKFKYK